MIAKITDSFKDMSVHEINKKKRIANNISKFIQYSTILITYTYTRLYKYICFLYEEI